MKAVGFTRYPGSFPGIDSPAIKHQEGIHVPHTNSRLGIYLPLLKSYIGKENTIVQRGHMDNMGLNNKLYLFLYIANLQL